MKVRIVAIAAALVVLLGACDVKGLILSPGNGEIVEGTTVVVDGVIPTDYALGGVLTVNGVVTAVNADRTWSQTISTTAGYTTPVEALYTEPGGKQWRQRIGLVNGKPLPEGTYSPDGVGLVFTNEGLDNMGPVIRDLAGSAFDIGGLLMGQNPIIEGQDLGFLGMTADASVYEAGIGGVDVAAKSTAAGAVTDITIDDLFLGLDLHITGGSIIAIDCKLELQIGSTKIGSTFDLEPDPASPNHVDVNAVGDTTVVTTGIEHEFIGGICDGDTFVIGDIVNALVPDMQALIGGGFETKMGDPDATGPLDSPIADAMEQALAGISIQGEVGSAVGVNLNAPLTSISESDSKITMQADADFFATTGTGPTDCQPPPGAPVIDSTYDVPGDFPTIPDVTPGSGEPYGVGMAISASSFNQLLAGMTECGQLAMDITELNLGGGAPLPITSDLLTFMAPQFANLPDGLPMKLVVRPTTSPFLTENAGPNGEMGELVLGNLLIDAVGIHPGGEIVWLTLAIDAPLGLNLAYDPVDGVLAPTIASGPVGSAKARVVTNNLGVNEPSVEALLSAMFPIFAGELSSSFQAFPLPTFMGLNLDVLEVARANNHFVLYGNLDNEPVTRIENATLVDMSSADSAVDSSFDVNEWRHRIRDTFSSSSLDVQYMGMLGADACCTVEDEQRSAKAKYQLAFDVVPENGDSWQVAIDHSILGAHTLIDEKVALEDAGGRSGFQTPVKGRVQVDGGAWQSFDFTVAPSSVTHALYGKEGTSNVQFSGANGLVLNGSSASRVTVEFEWDMQVKSDSNAFFPAAGGDEVALRFGAHDTITNGFAAGGYPGLGNRAIANDGHKVHIRLTSSS